MHFLKRIALWMGLAVSACVAQDAALTAKLDHAVEAYQKERRFIGAVFVAKGGSVLLDKGYGMADIEWDVPNGPTTKFRLGSITKQFTATAVMQLEEQGKLSVNDRACKYFDGCPEAWKQITIHQLLSHTSGIPSYTADPEFGKPRFMRVPLTPVEILLLSKDKPLEFDPGTKWKYDNSGYIFLGVIIEKVSGEKYADYLRKHIFSPLGMNDSGYDDAATILKNRASGYRPAGDGFANAEYLDMSLPYAAGSLYSTTRDMYLWDRSLYTDKLVSKASRNAMFTPVMSNYGYGLAVAPMFNHKQIGHNGGINGFSTDLLRFPDDDAVVIVLSNNAAGNADGVARALAGTLFGEKVTLPGEQKPVSIDPKTLDRYAGSYQEGPMTIAVTNEGGHLMIQPKGQGKLEAFPSSETTFFMKVADATLTFVPGEDGKAKELRLQQGGGTLVAKRIN
jgi:D-alanyl-D-alanine carboxypeptidase